MSLGDTVSGSVSGVLAAISHHPLDLIKTRIQVGSISDSRLTSLPHTLKTIVKNEGWRTLFRGIIPPICNGSTEYAVAFTCYSWLLKKMHKENEEPCPSQKHSINNNQKPHTCWSNIALAGAGVGVLVSPILTPTELIKSQMQVTKTISFTKCCADIYHTFGVCGFFRGISFTIMRDIPAYSCQFLVWEYLRQNLPLTSQLGNDFIAGGCGGLVCWLVSYPQDVIKTRLQTCLDRSSSLQSIIRKECAGERKMLFRGIGITLLNAILSNAVGFSCYEYCKLYY